MKTFIATTLGVVFGFCIFDTCTYAATITEVKTAIEGVYILDEWTIGGQTFRPPAVEGRFVILNGNIVTVLIDVMQESKKSYNALFGVYSLTPSGSAYKYRSVERAKSREPRRSSSACSAPRYTRAEATWTQTFTDWTRPRAHTPFHLRRSGDSIIPDFNPRD